MKKIITKIPVTLETKARLDIVKYYIIKEEREKGRSRRVTYDYVINKLIKAWQQLRERSPIEQVEEE